MRKLKTLEDLYGSLARSLCEQEPMSNRRRSAVWRRIAKLRDAETVGAPGSKRTLDEAKNFLRWDNSYSRLNSIINLEPHMAHDDWWTFLGSEWSGCDNISDFGEDLFWRLFSAKRPTLNLMMTPEALTAWRRLPAEFIVYRGCYEDNSDGLSWTLDKDIARKFLTYHRYRRPGETPLLLTGWARRKRSVLILDRDEDEIVCPCVDVVAQDELHETTAV